MLPYTFYKVVHIIGIILLMSALGAVSIHVLNGGTRATNRARGLVAGLHGTGALLILVGGFGMLARLGFQHGAMFPGWLLVKLAVWLVLSAALMLPYRKPSLSRLVYLSLPVLGGLAAYMAIYKPF
ncbi:MAG: hypothetical protein JO180_09865 [Gemmatirosa sp.]|nr:hypothetical protein [Gemmatirosa sp.]